MNSTKKEYDKAEREEIRRRYEKMMEGLKYAIDVSEEQTKNEVKKEK